MESQMEINSTKRKRGRPSGKNRVPLSTEERRARNAQYERERRMDNSEAMLQLAMAAGCDPNASNAEVLATVVHFLGRASATHQSESIDVLRMRNRNLLAQIADLENRLGVVSEESSDNEQYSYSNHSSCESESVTHNINVDRKRVLVKTETDSPYKRVKVCPDSPDAADSDAASLLAADHTSLPHLMESGSSNDGICQDFKHWSIEDFIEEYLCKS